MQINIHKYVTTPLLSSDSYLNSHLDRSNMGVKTLTQINQMLKSKDILHRMGSGTHNFAAGNYPYIELEVATKRFGEQAGLIRQ